MMRSVISFSLIGIFLLCFEISATEIDSGPVSGHWYASGNPYNINGEIIIPMDSTLNIHPGVQVIFQGGYKFIINGVLEAIGTEGDSILFTAADSSAGWHSLRFLSAQDTSHVSYCIIQYGRAPGNSGQDAQGGGIYCTYSNIVVSHCSIRRNYAGLCAAGILLDHSAAIVESCDITGNLTDGGAGGILVRYDPPGAVIRNCLIADNVATAVGGGGGGIFALYANEVNISDCQILNNEGYHEGGGILVLGSTAAISGCEISGNSTYNTNYWGGGGIAVCDISTAEIRDCVVTDNIAPNWIGGGISVGSSQATINDCEIAYNTSHQGGGINIQGSEVTVEGCDVNNNNATAGGGGIFVYAYNWQVDLTMSHCNIFANAGSGGGGIKFYNTSYQTAANLQNCVIASNYSAANGGGIVDYNFNLIMDRCTIAGNSAASLGAQMLIQATNPAISNTIVEGSSGNSSVYFSNAINTSISHCDVYNDLGANFDGSLPEGLGDLVGENSCGDSCDVYMNIFMDPMFIDPDINDFHLLANSPCIDAGNPESPYDPDGTVADIGCFYYDQLVGIDIPDEILPDKFSLFQNYPNPFNAQTTISYILSETAIVRINICDLLGRRIETLVNGEKQPGQHQVVWDASDRASGVYFYRIEAGDFTETKEMLLLK